MNLYALVSILVVAVIFVSILKELGRGKSSPTSKKYPYHLKRYLLTPNETECYKALVHTVGNDYFIFVQVHLSSLLDEKIPGNNWQGARSHINRKSVDFVLCDKDDISPVLAIELDDYSHSRVDRIERDGEVERILREARLPLLRIRDTENLKEKVLQKLNPHFASSTLTHVP